MLARRTLSLALALTKGIGGKTVTKVLTRNDLLGRSPDEFLTIGHEALIEEYGMSRAAAQSWTTNLSAWINSVKAIEERLVSLGVQWITAADAHYPQRIEQVDHDPPGVLFLYGNSRLLESDSFCVLSSRNTSSRGLAAIEALTERGVLDGKVLVSGHDKPEYQRSAVVPLRWGAPRVIVLDKGFFKALGETLSEEPFRAARLWRYQFDSKTDLAVSCMEPDKDYHPNSNKVRDRLVVGLSLAVNLVEVRPGGNMDKLARDALNCGRPVRVCHWAEGAEQLLRIGAKTLDID